MTVEKRVALITGGGSGVGAATARRLARDGVTVAVCGRREDRLRSVVEAVEAAGGRAWARSCDITDAGQTASLVDAVVRDLGGVDILVNNAAFYQPEAAVSTSDDLLAAHWEVNVAAPVRLARSLHATLAARSGVSIQVLSTSGQTPVPGTLAYSASKAALLSITQCLALEWAADGIRSVGLALGVIDTELHSLETLEAMAPLHPLGRVGTPEEAADAIAFLAGPESGFTTGAILNVDGGIGLN